MGTTYNTANPAYIVDHTLTEGEAWVACATHVETGTGTVNITLSSTTGCNNWSQYQDLVLVMSLRSEASGSAQTYPQVFFNGDTTAAHYRRQALRDDGSATLAFEQQNSYLITCPGSTGLANTFGTTFMRIHSINAGYCKTVATQSAHCDNDTSAGTTMTTMIYGNVDSADVYYGAGDMQKAITSITFKTTTGWQSGSRFDIFGVLPKLVVG